MRAETVMHHTLAGRRKLVAEKIGISTEAINRQCEAPVSVGGNGYPSFLERLITATRTLRESGADTSEDLILFACGQLGYRAIRVEAVPSDPIDIQIPAALSKEHADILQVWVRAFANGTLSISEAEEFRHEIRDLQLVLGGWDLGLQAFIEEHDESLVAGRRPPKRSAPRLTIQKRATA